MGDLGIVGHEDDGLAVVLGEAGQDVENKRRVLDVQVARGLVREDDGRLVGERARDRDPLLLPAGKVRPQPVELVAQADRLQEVGSRAPASPSASRRPSLRMGIITFSSAVNSSIRKWNWKTNPMCSPRALVRIASSLLDISLAVDPDLPAVGLVEEPQEVQEGRLPAPGRARRSRRRCPPGPRT